MTFICYLIIFFQKWQSISKVENRSFTKSYELQKNNNYNISLTTLMRRLHLRSFPPSIHVLFQNLQIDTNIKRQLIIFNSDITFGGDEYFSCVNED